MALHIEKEINGGHSTSSSSQCLDLSQHCLQGKRKVELNRIKGLKETTHGYKKNETKRMISHSNCNTMFLQPFASYR